MKIGIIALTRMSSSRLPGKALKDIGGRPLLGRVIDRLRCAATDLDCTLIVATSEEPEDDAIAEFCRSEIVKTYRGSLHDVAGRALSAATHSGLDYFIRISADSPFMSPDVIGLAASIVSSEEPDLTTNIFPRTYPPGVTVEVVKTSTFRKLLENPTTEDEREHVTKAFYNRPQGFKIVNFTAPEGDLSAINLTVDTHDDLRKARWIYSKLGQHATTAPLAKIVGLAREFEQISNSYTA
jgi:spore coat polysaccharide biosynthesis protein SpsF (cytidylyltransferase family)